MQRQRCETVRCTVSNCKYWGENNFCIADQILVTAPKSPLPSADKHGAGAERLSTTPVMDAQDSLCYTFEPKRT
ncbi:MAG: DUF1540 domain-containing protein [Chloroflexi bacterium]|nr:DUF1540 domain-containing protein [Chloroflexota bacterium]